MQFSISRAYGQEELGPSMLKLTSKVKLHALFQKIVEIWPQIVSNRMKNAILNFSDLWPRGTGPERAEIEICSKAPCALPVRRNLAPRVLRLLGQQFGRQERLWGNGIFSIFLIGYSGNNEIGEAEVGSMLTLPSIMSRTSQETRAIFQRGQQVTLLVRDWRISIHLQHLLVSAFG